MSFEIIEPSDEPLGRSWEEIYSKERTRFYDYTREIHSILEKVLAQERLDVVSIEARTKSIDSFLNKLDRESAKYNDPLNDITDLSACRIICYYFEDIETIDSLIRDNFAIDERNSVKKDQIENPKEFGYLSRHLVVEMNSDRLKLSEFKRFKGMKCEIQVRTVLQHAWAAIEHKLQYKVNQDVPQPLQRKLFQISAMLEVADGQFSFIRDSLASIRQGYRDTISHGGGVVPLNLDSIEIYISDSKYLEQLKDELPSIGYSISPPPPNARNPLAKLNETLRGAKISDVKSLDERVKVKKISDWLKDFQGIIGKWKESMPERRNIFGTSYGPKKLVLDDTAIIRIMVLLSSPPTVSSKILREVPFGGKLQMALHDFIGGRATTS
ncbi:GTP pyrophosphokinase [Defluviimonas sp. SAOS-178_SWC]|uniref:GTP pyrophosphokinase n=1 Tax=Defluviimonas sp. SAOS-178_SWC TaxID=3121287 RepID=UPI003222068E